MLITFSCPECKMELEVAASAGGSQVLCPQCSKTLTVPPKGPGPGSTIGQFKILKLIGKGGMGEVYLARQLSLGRDIALKILPARLRGQKARVQRFFKEVQILARLDHPNIVMAHEAGEDEDILYLAMSYVPGNSLEKCLQQNGPMAESDALKLIDKLAGALDYAWREHHLLHRDIKPANILLTSSGEAKLTDFGLAKCLDDVTELTMSGDIIGSPNYMSPEQINNCPDLDFRSDMYSLGTTLYHLLTGKLPFAGSTLIETLKKQINEFLPDPRIERPGISEECIILLEIMLAKNRNDRHADYQTLRADIARVIAGERPTKGALQPGESMLLRLIAERTPHRPKAPPAEIKPTTKQHRPGVKLAVGVMLGIAVVLGLVVVLARGSCRMKQTALSAPTIPGIVTVTSAPVVPGAASLAPVKDEVQVKLNERYLDALKYAREHPDDFTGIQDMLASLGKESKGTEWEGKIADEIRRMERARKWAVYKVVTALKADVQALVAQSNFESALKRIELDTGPVTEETTAVRTELAQEVKARKQALAEAQAMQAAEAEQARQTALAREKLTILTQEAADDLLKGNDAELARRTTAARADPALGMVSNAVNKVTDLALQAIAWPERVVKSFEAERHKEVAVEFKNGKTERLEIMGVEGERIKAQRKLATGFIGRDFTVNDLSTREKLKRLGDDPQAAVKLMRGLLMVRSANDWASAEKEFAACGPLGEALVQLSPASQMPAAISPDKLSGAKSDELSSAESKMPTSSKTIARKPMGPKERQAHQALLNLLKIADVSYDPANVQAVADTIRRKEFSPNTMEKINEALTGFFNNYAQTETAQDNDPIINALANASRPLPPTQRPLKPKWRREWRPLY